MKGSIYMKKTAIIIAAALSALLLAACEKEPGTVPVDGTPEPASAASVSDTEAAKAETSAADITAAITAEIEISSAIEKTAENIGAFYDIDTASVTDMSVFICGSGAYPDELAVFRFDSADSAKAGAEAVRKRLDSQLALYRDYTPDEVYKLEGAAVIEKDNWVIFAACSDNDRAKEIVEGLL
ncbi:MAG: DUF4358 domain-containing protein [Oscillospiraceae bacterium]|nr:DUF4358 domain-containing protein [Oscillospiraceae bacterium]